MGRGSLNGVLLTAQLRPLTSSSSLKFLARGMRDTFWIVHSSITLKLNFFSFSENAGEDNCS